MLIPLGFLSGGSKYYIAQTSNTNPAWGVSVDSQGNHIISGSGTYVIKTDNTGQIIWQRLFSHDRTAKNGTDSSNNVYVLTHGAGTSLVKLDSSGNLVWRKQVAGSGTISLQLSQILVAGSGDSYLAGHINETGNPQVGVVVKIDSSGNQVWQRRIQGITFINAIALSGSGLIGVAGTDSTGKQTFSVMNPSGTESYTRTLTTSLTTNSVAGLAFGSDDSVYLNSGNTDGGSNQVMLLSRVLSNGTLSWTQFLTGAGFAVQGVRLDSSDDIFVATATVTPTANAVIVRYNSSGTLQWQRFLNQGNAFIPYGFAMSQGDPLVAGSRLATVSLRPDGTITGNYQVASQTYTYSTSNLSNGTQSGVTIANVSGNYSSTSFATISDDNVTISTSSLTMTVVEI
jgi:hypothetical protein